MPLPTGSYDLLLTEALTAQVPAGSAVVAPSFAAAADYLADALSRQVAAVLEDLPGKDDEKLRSQLELVNGVLVALRTALEAAKSGSRELVDPVSDPPRVLRAVPPGTRGDHPDTGLVFPWLFTAARNSPSLLQEIRRELASADGVDILVSFITVSGVRKLIDVLKAVTAVGADEAPPTRLRILTTTYTGATEQRALDQLARLPGCEVRVSLDGRRTRLHAKAWVFRRKTGFGSAYIGSANLSGAALTGGLEWTVKLTERTSEAIYRRACAHFETLWEDAEFERYDPDNPEDRAALAAALGRECGDHDAVTPVYFGLQPKTYQQDMLDALASEREHGRTKSLLVAATGTGKTVVAAFDYERTARSVGGRPKLLFIAHRSQILQQALHTYRHVLRDHGFGEVLAGGREPASFDHLFATIDSATSRRLLEKFGPEYWHTVVIDECHRLAADRFDQFVRTVRPRLLLGLTATPERSDGRPIGHYFDERPDGRPAVELRLWHALELQLLAPFEYYGCDDDTDFTQVPWGQAGEPGAIDKLVTGNHVRARLIIDEWARHVDDPRKSHALVFCVTVEHARFMTAQLNSAGLPAACVVGDMGAAERQRALSAFRSGSVCALVTVDLYNEGVDIPEVDTLLLLRPTQSPVVFQQQIGRGLRLSQGKDSCLVLDFVGQHRAEFRFDRLLSTLTGLTREQLQESLEHGFGMLPAGCHLHLQKIAREQVLKSLRKLSGQTWNRLRADLASYAVLKGRSTVSLASFVREQSVDLADIYRDHARSGWTNLKRAAGLLASEPGPEEEYLSRRFGDLLHVDDPAQIDLLRRAAADGPAAAAADGAIRAQMLAYQLDTRNTGATPAADFLARLSLNPENCGELLELADALEARSDLLPVPLPGLEQVPLCLHGAYSSREILTAVGWLTGSRRIPFRAGVLAMPQRRAELLFVTLDKSSGYHDRIAYRDYAISRELFHWQSQNSASPETIAGRRYLESGSNGWTFQLFVRRRKGEAYRACGPVSLVRAEGQRPMNITWRLSVPLPARLFAEFSVLKAV